MAKHSDPESSFLESDSEVYQGKAKAHRFEHIDRPVTVLNISGVDENEDQKSAGVGKNVALAAPDFLARVPGLRQGRLRPKPHHSQWF